MPRASRRCLSHKVTNVASNKPTQASGPVIDRNTHLRLARGAAIAFPDGDMTASGMRREAGRGRLTIERVAGKDYVTLAKIDAMRQR
jgi:hypothetical protein